jgi:hypothetical protein
LYGTTVVHKLYDTDHKAKFNFVNWYLLGIYDVENDHAFILLRNKALVSLSGYTNSQNNRQLSATLGRPWSKNRLKHLSIFNS